MTAAMTLPSQNGPRLMRQARNLLSHFTPYANNLVTTWTVTSVRSALQQHEEGYFQASAQLCDSMGRDDRLSATIETRGRGLLSCPVDFHGPDDMDDKSTEMIVTELGSHWHKMFPEAVLLDMLKWRRMLGFAIVELRWKTKAKRWGFTPYVWHPQHAYYLKDSDEWHLSTKEGDITITPGDGRWFIFGAPQDPFMDGALRSLATLWLIREWVWRDWARYSERHGMPIMRAHVPALADDGDKDDFFQSIKAMAGETSVQLPTNLDDNGASFELDALEFTDKSFNGFKLLLDQIADSYAVRLLGHNLTSEVRGGSFAAASTGDTIRGDLKAADGEELSTQIRQNALKHWASLNFEGGEERVPWAVWQTSPKEDVKAGAEGAKIVGMALQTIKDAGFKMKDPEAFGERFGLEIEEREMGPNPFAPGGPAAPSAPAPPQKNEPKAPGQDPDEAEDGEVADERKQQARLASGESVTTAGGFLSGQLYADAIADDAVTKAARAIRPDLKTLVDIVETSLDPSDLRARLREAYADMSPDAFSRVMEKSILLGALAGRWAVLEDV